VNGDRKQIELIATTVTDRCHSRWQCLSGDFHDLAVLIEGTLLNEVAVRPT